MTYFDTSCMLLLVGENRSSSCISSQIPGSAIKVKSFAGLLKQFEADCDQEAFHWLPLFEVVVLRAKKTYAELPANVFVGAADDLHLACAAENGQLEL